MDGRRSAWLVVCDNVYVDHSPQRIVYTVVAWYFSRHSCCDPVILGSYTNALSWYYFSEVKITASPISTSPQVTFSHQISLQHAKTASISTSALLRTALSFEFERARNIRYGFIEAWL